MQWAAAGVAYHRGGSVIIGGDFQMTKLELEYTGFHRMIGCTIIPVSGDSPTVKSCERTIDHIIATSGVAEVCSKAEVLAEHAPSPHRPVRVKAGVGNIDMVTILRKKEESVC